MKSTIGKSILLFAALIIVVSAAVCVKADEKWYVAISASDFVEIKTLTKDDYLVINSEISNMFKKSDDCAVEMFCDGKVVVYDSDTQLSVDWDNSLINYEEYQQINTHIGELPLQRNEDGTLTILPISTYGMYFYSPDECGGGGQISPWVGIVKQYGIEDMTVDEGAKSYDVGKHLTEAKSEDSSTYDFGVSKAALVVIEGTMKDGKEFVSYVVLIPEGNSLLEFESEKLTEETTQQTTMPQVTTPPATQPTSTQSTTDAEEITTVSKEETTVDNENHMIQLDTDNTVVHKDDFVELLKENANKDIVIKSNEDVVFTFEKGSMSEVSGVENYDFGTTVDKEFDLKAEYSSNVEKEQFVTLVKFNYSGELPGKASIKIFVGISYEGQTLHYSQINGSELKYIQSAVVNSEGYITVSQSHCSDYILTKERIESSELEASTEEDTKNLSDKKETENKDDEEKDGFLVLVIVIVILVFAGVGAFAVTAFIKKKKNK